jgi:hypothetical protein
VKTISAHSICFGFLDLQKKYSSHGTVPFSEEGVRKIADVRGSEYNRREGSQQRSREEAYESCREETNKYSRERDRSTAEDGVGVAAEDRCEKTAEKRVLQKKG